MGSQTEFSLSVRTPECCNLSIGMRGGPWGSSPKASWWDVSSVGQRSVNTRGRRWKPRCRPSEHGDPLHTFGNGVWPSSWQAARTWPTGSPAADLAPSGMSIRVRLRWNRRCVGDWPTYTCLATSARTPCRDAHPASPQPRPLLLPHIKPNLTTIPLSSQPNLPIP